MVTIESKSDWKFPRLYNTALSQFIAFRIYKCYIYYINKLFE
jgi:hypothetical protein